MSSIEANFGASITLSAPQNGRVSILLPQHGYGQNHCQVKFSVLACLGAQVLDATELQSLQTVWECKLLCHIEVQS